MYKISLIGSGRVAWQLAQALENSGHIIGEVWSRTPENAASLADHLYSTHVQNHLDFSESCSKIFLVSVADKAIEEVANQLILPPDAIVAHTAGTMPMELLQPASEQYGVFYPLQTFSKERKPGWQEIPLCLEAVDEKTLHHLKEIAGTLSRQVICLDARSRKVLHLSAVFACNFTNHMIRISEELLEDQGIEPEVLHPLISETLRKSMEIGAKRAQTGPAAREDMLILSRHLELLESRPDYAELYKLISKNIIHYNKK